MGIHDDYARYRALETYADAQDALSEIHYLTGDHDGCEHPSPEPLDQDLAELLRDQILPAFAERILLFEVAYDTLPIDSDEMDDAMWELWQATETADMAISAASPTDDDFDISEL